LVFEQSNEIFQRKICKLEEIAENYESLKGEMVLLNKELTREIEKNKKLLLENDQIKEKTHNWQNTYSNLGNLIKNAARAEKFEDFQEKDQKNLKFLESLLEKQQNELESKRNLVEGLKEKVNTLEDSVFSLKKDKQKLELQVQELEDINERLLTALKRKNHICKHRSSTPDIASQKNMLKTYDPLKSRNT
jgi:chromosome segregation ATPase